MSEKLELGIAGVSNIDSFTFLEWSGLTDIKVPKSVENISYGSFYNCRLLESIAVSEDNEKYSSENGVLFNKDKTELIQYPRGKRDTQYVVPSSVTKIGKYAFFGCEALENIIVPDSVTEIGYGAFYECTTLTSVTLPEGLILIDMSVFDGCKALTGITIPNSVTSIGAYAFCNCTALKSIAIPGGVTTIKNATFYGCRALSSIAIPSSVTAIEAGAFEYCTSLANVYYGDAEDRWNSIFIGENNKSLINVVVHTTSVIASGVHGDLTWALNADGNLIIDKADRVHTRTVRRAPWYPYEGQIKGVVITDKVDSLGFAPFLGCRSLTSITIPESIKSIGDFTFNDCRSLKEVNIPKSVTHIGCRAFENCINGIKINVDEQNLVYSSSDGVLFNKNKTVLMSCVGGDSKDFSIPTGVEVIGSCAFYNCQCLTHITIPDSVTNISRYAFDRCYSLTDIYYCGDEKQWEDIVIEEDNEPLNNAKVHYAK